MKEGGAMRVQKEQGDERKRRRAREKDGGARMEEREEVSRKKEG